MPLITASSDYFPIRGQGSYAKYNFASTELNLGGSIVPLGSITSPLLVASGYKNIAVGVKSPQAGQITVQRYIDEQGQIPQGAAITGAISANTHTTLNINDGAIFGSFTVSISNSGAAPAVLNNIAVAIQAA